MSEVPKKPLTDELDLAARLEHLLSDRVQESPSDEQLPAILRKARELEEALARLEHWWRRLEILDDSAVPYEDRNRRYGAKSWWTDTEDGA